MSKYPSININGHKLSLIEPFTIDDMLIMRYRCTQEFSLSFGDTCDYPMIEFACLDLQTNMTKVYRFTNIYLYYLLTDNFNFINININGVDITNHIKSRIKQELSTFINSNTCTNRYIYAATQNLYNCTDICLLINNDIRHQVSIDYSRSFEFNLLITTLLDQERIENTSNTMTIYSDNTIYDSQTINTYCLNSMVSYTNYNPDNIIHSHNYKPQYIKHFLESESENNTLLLGAEIEVDCGGESKEHAKKVLEIMNADKQEEYIYCVHDGSLKNGLEFPTMPCSLEFHKTLPYKEMFQYLDEHGYASHDTKTCGLHIHINRSFFGNKQNEEACIGKLIYIIEKFTNEFSVLSRRDCKYSRLIGYSGEKINDLHNKYNKTYDFSDKYKAINTQHKDTIEIRCFKGTLKYSTFMLTLEFVKDLAYFVKDHSIEEVESMQWSDLYDTFSNELKEYYEERKNRCNDTNTSDTNHINGTSHDDSISSFIDCFISVSNMMCDCNTERPLLEQLEANLRDTKLKLKRERNYMAKRYLQNRIEELNKTIKSEKRRLRNNARNN